MLAISAPVVARRPAGLLVRLLECYKCCPCRHTHGTVGSTSWSWKQRPARGMDMLMLDNSGTFAYSDHAIRERAGLVKSLDMASLWQSCSALISKVLPCHSCSLLFDIDGYQPNQGRHLLTEGREDGVRLATSLDVAAPYLDANPRIRWYTFSQIASQDAHASDRLKAQNPTPGWREFIHFAFWEDSRLEAVLSIRILHDHGDLTESQLSFLKDLYYLLDASLQRIRTLESERTRQSALESLLYDLPLATILLEEDLTPCFVSQEARRLCRRWSDDFDKDDALPRAIEEPLRQWLEASAGSRDLPLGKSSLVIGHHHRPGHRLRVEVSSSPAGNARNSRHLLILAPDVDDDSVVDASSPRVLPLLNCLSPSERKVAALVAEGLRNEVIAQRLFRSRKTVESQISSIFRKLNVANRTQLARLLN
ncbi:regulatory protein, luxR family [Pseudoxanthomonas indica]|uniref:Regulatory protein, luxR family n=2 Tax=Pseudoxanthomonas indica TaxID=428993 RepID=A0A1T5KC15_9GAMM|nr:regulatory protein, luxR family [Pseudoxanthomonas indica]